MVGRYEINRSSQVSPPSVDDETKCYAPAEIKSFEAIEVQDIWRVLVKNASINSDMRLV